MAALRGIRTRWVRNQVRRKWPFPSRAARAGKQRDVIRSMCPLSSCCPRCQSMYLSACLLSCVFLCVSTVCVLSVQLSSPLSARYVSLVKPNSSDRVHTRVPLHLLLHLNDTWLLKLILILKVVYMWDILKSNELFGPMHRLVRRPFWNGGNFDDTYAEWITFVSH